MIIIKKLAKTMFIVTIFSCVERLLGFIYRIFLSRNLTSEGMGIYQISLSVIGLLMTITASGIPITVSRLMVKNKAERNYTNRYTTVFSGIFLSLLVSVPIVLILLLFPNILNFVFTDDRCYDVLSIILPGVIITGMYAVIRGFFWGEKRFLAYSIIELLEEIVMLVFGVILISNAVSIYDGTIKAGYAVLYSYIFSFITATISYFILGGKFASPFKELKPLITSSMPITLMRTSTSLINTLIAIILPAQLVALGIPSSEALSRFGELSGMSIPLIYIPSTIIGSIALVLVPELSDNFYRHNDVTMKNNIEKAVKCSVFIACLIIPSFISMGKEIGEILYSNTNSGIYVSRASIIMFPMSITLITTSMLNSLNLERKTLYYYLIGALFLMICVYFLPRFIGVYSLVLGLLLSYSITAICNLFLIKKTCKKPPKLISFLIASFIFIIPSTLLGYLLKKILGHFIPTVLSVMISSIVTTIFCYLFYKIFDLFDVKTIFK